MISIYSKFQKVSGVNNDPLYFVIIYQETPYMACFLIGKWRKKKFINLCNLALVFWEVVNIHLELELLKVSINKRVVLKIKKKISRLVVRITETFPQKLRDQRKNKKNPIVFACLH